MSESIAIICDDYIKKMFKRLSLNSLKPNAVISCFYSIFEFIEDQNNNPIIFDTIYISELNDYKNSEITKLFPFANIIGF